MRKMFGIIFISAILSSISLAAGQADRENPDSSNAHRYYDRTHKDYHNWDGTEDRAYHLWVADQHRKDVTFDTLAARDQSAYWAWRHNHSNAVLKIDVH